MCGCRWNEEEDQKLKRLWPNTPEVVLLKEFYPRSMQALRNRAGYLGVKRVRQQQVLNNILRNQQALKEKQVMAEKGMV